MWSHYEQPMVSGIWTIFYFAYIMWWVGIMMFFIFLNSSDPYKYLQKFQKDPVAGILMVWMVGSVLLIHIAWPLLCFGPLFLVTTLQAPIISALIAYAYAGFCMTLIIFSFKKRYGHILT